MEGGANTDTASFAGGAAVTVDLSAGTATGQGSDTLSNIENVLGSANADNITGSAGNNSLDGGAGNDTLNGGTGDYTLEGGVNTDTASFAGGAAVTVDLAAGTATGQGSDTLSNIEHVLGSGNGDNITGSGGGQQPGRRRGRRHADRRHGGGYADRWRERRYDIWTAANQSGTGSGNRDIITDFVQGDDVIDLSAFAGATWLGTGAFTGAANTVRYVQPGGDITVIQVDTDGDAAANFEIELTGVINLAVSDFTGVAAVSATQLTAGAFDNLVGTGGADAFTGSTAAHWHSTDTVAGGAGARQPDHQRRDGQRHAGYGKL